MNDHRCVLFNGIHSKAPHPDLDNPHIPLGLLAACCELGDTVCFSTRAFHILTSNGHAPDPLVQLAQKLSARLSLTQVGMGKSSTIQLSGVFTVLECIFPGDSHGVKVWGSWSAITTEIPYNIVKMKLIIQDVNWHKARHVLLNPLSCNFCQPHHSSVCFFSFRKLIDYMTGQTLPSCVSHVTHFALSCLADLPHLVRIIACRSRC